MGNLHQQKLQIVLYRHRKCCWILCGWSMPVCSP
nr:unnamed protein product [Callosobruchus chinensis]